MKYFLGLSSNFTAGDTLRHTFATGSEFDLSELRAFLAAHYGATYDHVAVYANGRTALSAAVKAVTKRGGKVVVTSLTCYAVVQAVKNAGCVPVFADIDKETLHFGAPGLKKALDGETNVQAIIVQNNLGIPVDIAAIEEVAREHKLAIIEDLAHCAGVRYADGREAGTVGRVAALSFGKGKSIDTITGGAVVFTNPLDPPVKQPENPPVFKDNFRARFYPLFSSIIRGGYHLHPKFGRALTAGFIKIHAIKRSADGKVTPGLRTTFWQCKLALRQLQSLPHRGRKPLRDFYLVDDRDAVLDELEKKGYEFQDLWYDTPVAPERYFHKADFHAEACPVAAEVATQIINVPTWYSKEELRPAIRIIKRHLIEGAVDEPDEEEIAKEETVKEELVKEESAQSEDVGGAKTEKVSENAGDAKAEKVSAAKGVKAKFASAAKVAKSVSLPKIAKKSAKKFSKNSSEDSSKKPEKPKTRKQPKELPELEQKSDILSAMENKKEQEKEQTEKEREKSREKQEKEPIDAERVAESPEKANHSKTSEQQTKQVALGKETKSSAPAIRQNASKSDPAHVITKSGSMPGMRIAPEKLSDREKLKAELEEGKKGERSVF